MTATQQQNLSKESCIPVFFCIDNSYAPFMGVAASSIIKNANPERLYKIHVLYQDLSEKHREQIAALAQDNVSIEFIPMEGKIQGIQDCASNRLRQDYFTLTIFFRLFIPLMFPQYNKAIYIDSDVVVLDDIAKMYDVDLGNTYLGAIHDYSVMGIKPLHDYIRDMVGIDPKTYINSGVLLMNCELLRNKQFAQRFLELLGTYNFMCEAPDQDYLNFLCNGNITYLDPVWDAMPVGDTEPIANPKLIHYNLFDKPWCYDNIPYEEHFWKYARQTPFIDEILAFKAAYSDEKKAADKACLERMAQNGPIFSAAPVTFKTLFESGKEGRL